MSALGPLFAEQPDADEPPPQATQPTVSDDFAALRAVLDLCGCFRPAPPDPPWADPRPDLIADHARWLLVLELAYRRDAADPEGVFGALFGVRCCGARIEHADDDWTLLPHRAALEEFLLGRKP